MRWSGLLFCFLLAFLKRGGQRCPFALGFHFGATKAKDLVCIVNRFSVDVIFVRRKKIEYVPELVEQDQDLSVHRITRVRPYICHAWTAIANRAAFSRNLNYIGNWREKGSSRVDSNCRVASITLKNLGDIRIPEDGHVVRRFGLQDEFLSLAVYHISERSKSGSRIRVFFPEPGGTGI